jgi:hypothetical protein
LQLFQDMRIEDMPVDLRSTLSVESDPTATFSHSDGGVDVELFHASLGRITGWHPSPPNPSPLDRVKGDEGEGDSKNSTKDDDEGAVNRNTTSGRRRSLAVENDDNELLLGAEQLLRSLPSDADNDDDTGNGASPRHATQRNRKNVLCGAMIEQALLGASLNSLQSLSLEEIRQCSSLSSCANPGAFMARTTTTTTAATHAGECTRSDHVPDNLAKARSVARMAAVPPASPRRHATAGTARQHHHHHPSLSASSKGHGQDRLHQSMPMMDVKISCGGGPEGPNGRDAASYRPGKPEWKAPPSVVALSLSQSLLTVSSDYDERGDQTSRLSPSKVDQQHFQGQHVEPRPAAASAGAVVIRKKRALPSIQCLFPEDSAPPSTAAATTASC